MTTWTETAVYTYWWRMVWALGTFVSSGDTGINSLWSPGLGDTTEHRSRDFAGDPGGPSLSHYLQNGSIYGPTTLGCRVGSNVGGGPRRIWHGGFQLGCAAVGSTFLRGQWDSCIDPGNPSSTGVWHPDVFVWPCVPPHQYGQYC